MESNDEAALQALGQRLARHRLNRNQTQEALAREAGVARVTVSKAENGRVIDTQSLLRILRALGLSLDVLAPEPRISPVALARAEGRVRERASGYRGQSQSRNKPAGEWTWPDEEQ